MDKSESYLRSRGVKDADDKNKYKKKQDGRKSLQIEKDKEPYLQGNGRNKLPPDCPPNVTQQQPDLEVENWKNMWIVTSSNMIYYWPEPLGII